MLKIKGVNVWPSTIDEIVLAFPAVADYRGVVYSDPRRGDCMEIRLFFREDAGETGEARTALMERVRTEVKHRTLVTPVIVESDEQLIPTSDLKPRRWTDQRRAAPSTPVPA
jgi:phenylacetate-CoA ligase